MEQILFINLIFSVLIIFFQRKDPATVWAWLLLLYFIPVLGFALYLIFGQGLRKERMFRAKEIESELKYAAFKQKSSIYREELKICDPELDRFKRLMLYNLNEGKAVLTDNNDVRAYTDGKDKFRALLNDLEHAESYIHMQYYIIRRDGLWEEIERVLVRKAAEGVEVRVLFDSMGCRGRSGIGRAEKKRLTESGVQVAEFFPAIMGKLQLRMNYRNHRKIVVIDGRTGFLGGFNIGEEYLGRDPKFGYWRDTHIRVEGSAVTSLAVRFVLDWNFAAKDNLFLKDSLFQIPSYKKRGDKLVQIISSGPDSASPLIRDNYLRLIHMAARSIYIQTPYFIPDEDIRSALLIAIRSGVDVRIMIPCKPDHPFVYWATCSYVGEMVEAGAKCYIYDNGFLHTKCLCVDSLVCCVGTANMDIRSFSLNFEVNAVIYDAGTTKHMIESFRQDIAFSTLITRSAYKNRSLLLRAKEQFCRLLSPIL